MLDNHVISAMIPARDIKASTRKSWASNWKGTSVVLFRCKVYQTRFSGTGQHTLAAWDTDNLEREVAELRRRGVGFEEYNSPKLKTRGARCQGAPRIRSYLPRLLYRYL